MKVLFSIIVSASLALLALSGSAPAQAPSGAEARLKALNIALPPDTAPAANFVNSVITVIRKSRNFFVISMRCSPIP
jgi:hypothetical protein